MSVAIVPNSPMKTLVAGLIAVSMNPLAMLIAQPQYSHGDRYPVPVGSQVLPTSV